VKFQNAEIKLSLKKIKTWFQGEISECRNKNKISKIKHAAKLKFQNVEIK
jgi:hypothetical protein